MEQVNYKKKKQQNKQLLIIFKKLEQLEESCWSKLFRFQKSQTFRKFEQNYSVPSIISLRLDDFIYLVLLIIQQLIFGLLPIDSSSSFTKPYRQSLALFFITSFMAMISPHWFRWLSLFLFCVGYPIMIFISFNGYFTLMPVDTSQAFFNYMGYLTLIPIFVFLILIYPLKQYIRNHAGSLYSYIYGLAITLIIYLWPLYSFIEASGSFSFDFITSNKPLIISFITILVIGFYFFIHHSLFELKFDKIKQILLADFSQGELTQALQQSQEQYNENPSFFVDNFNVFIRFMSFIFFAITLGCQIYLYLVIAQDSSKVTYVGPIMGYIMAFLLLGAFLIYLPISKQVFIPFVAVISLTSAALSFTYYTSSTESLQYYIISLSFPFFAVYWSLIKVINVKKPLLRTRLIIILYIVLYLPVIGLVLNIYEVFSQDSSTVDILQYVFYSLIGVSLLCMVITFIFKQISQKKEQKKQQQRQKIGVDYNYSQQGNSSYQHYQITSSVSVSSFSNVDIRDTGYLVCMLFFLISQMMTIHAINQLNTTFSSTTFYSEAIRQIIYSQFYVVFIFYIYSHVYMASQSQTNKYIFSIYFFLTAIVFFVISYLASSTGSTAFKFIGGFSLAMILVVLGLQAIKQYMIQSFGFISSIIVIAVWLFIIFPYVVMIPFISIFVDQTRFGVFIYGCILATVVLLVFMVGILTLIFNKLIDKYQQEKKYKFMIEDVSTLLQQQGVDAQDSQLHILYESYLYRDKKYVFFLKKGYPLNLLKDPDDQITKLVTSQDYNMKRIPTKKEMAEEKIRQTSCLWACLTCFCGEDEEEIVQKIKKAKKQMDKQELKSLLPKSLAKGMIKSQNMIVPHKKKKKIINTTKVFSSKSLLLKSLHPGPRYLGDQYILLKTNKHTDLAIQIWHSIFYFAANKDEGQALLIANDFELLMNASGVEFTKAQYNQIFQLYASKKWNQYSGMDLQNFSLAIEHICQKIYSNGSQKNPPQDRKYYFLINTVYFNLLGFEQFTNYTFQKKQIDKNSTKRSPFTHSYKRYKQFIANNKYKQLQMIEKVNNYNRNKLAQPQQIEVNRSFQKQQSQKQPSISCKKSLFQKVRACQQSCKKQENRDQIEKKLFVKPWNLLSIDVVKILQRKQNEWSSSNDTKQHPFRITSNNILMAVFKILDLYTYISISIMNSHIPWFQSTGSSSSNLYLSYSTQTYLAAGVVAISVPLSIRGILFIFEDRLGLTENRLPAAFPHPMFFFTFIYKLMILSLFNIITQTFLDGFNCNWTDSSTTKYYLTDESSMQCLSNDHSKFLLIGLIGIILYYPLSSYAMPNFQFAEKSLDLKYRSSYLILYFQVNFAMLAGKVLLNSSDNVTLQIIYNSINIGGLLILAISVFTLQPCLITWFNYVQLMVVGIGLIVNVVGLVLYITDQWVLCLILVVAGCCLFVIIIIIVVKKKFFSKLVYQAEAVDENVQELEMMWYYKQNKGKKLIEYDEKTKNKANFGLIANDVQGSAQDSLQAKTRS